MKSRRVGGSDIPSYIAAQPPAVRPHLRKLRATIRAIAPRAAETIKYGIPTYVLEDRNLVHFGGFREHVSLFPSAAGIREFRAELRRFKTARGTIQFPLTKPLPLGLIRRIVRFRVRQVRHEASR